MWSSSKEQAKGGMGHKKTKLIQVQNVMFDQLPTQNDQAKDNSTVTP